MTYFVYQNKKYVQRCAIPNRSALQLKTLLLGLHLELYMQITWACEKQNSQQLGQADSQISPCDYMFFGCISNQDYSIEQHADNKSEEISYAIILINILFKYV